MSTVANNSGAQRVLEGFETVGTEIQPRLIMSVQGPQKRGKTHFACTAPGPIAIQNIDLGHEGVVHKFVAGGKRIFMSNYMLPTKDPIQADYIELWDRLKVEYFTALSSPAIKTLILDTATDIWDLARLARLGKLSKVLPHHYTEVNFEFKELIRAAFHSDKNVIFIHQEKDDYVNDVKTGEKVLAGFSKMGFLVQVNVAAFRNSAPRKDDPTKYDLEFGVRVLDCRQNPALIGQELTGDFSTFPMLAMSVLPGTKPEDWE